MILAGLFGGNLSCDNTARGVLRVNPDGSHDSTFDPGLGAEGPVYSILPQQDRVIIAGHFTKYNGNIRTRLARINATGTLSSKAPVS
ncbi:MAG: hypothetical protein EOO89_21445, partial [Pedobacter sp.]